MAWILAGPLPNASANEWFRSLRHELTGPSGGDQKSSSSAIDLTTAMPLGEHLLLCQVLVLLAYGSRNTFRREPQSVSSGSEIGRRFISCATLFGRPREGWRSCQPAIE